MFTIKSLKAFIIVATCLGLALLLSFCNRERATDSITVGQDNYGFMRFGGIERTYHIHFPPSYDETKPAPLLLAFHGLGGNGKWMEGGTILDDIADKKGFIVVYRDGYKSSWSDGSGASPSGRDAIDDVGFVSALIDKLAKELRIDLNRFYATGF